MSNLATVQNGGAIAPLQGLQDWQVDLLKSQLAKGCTDGELQYFLSVAQQSGLNPWKKQIYAIKRRSKNGPDTLTIQTGIDGYRLVAARTGSYAGSDSPMFDEGLTAHEFAKTGRKHPTSASVTVYRVVGGHRCPFTGEVLWMEFSQNTPMWGKMPCNQLAKCAEAQALRKAFPDAVEGLDTGEEPAYNPYEGVQLSPTDFREHENWRKCQGVFYRADSAEKVQQALEWAHGLVNRGHLPESARRAIDEEASVARDRLQHTVPADAEVVQQDIQAQEIQAHQATHQEFLRQLGWTIDDLETLCQGLFQRSYPELSLEQLADLSSDLREQLHKHQQEIPL